jgi:hypothetical protein
VGGSTAPGAAAGLTLIHRFHLGTGALLRRCILAACMKGDNGKEECLEPLAPKLESNFNMTKFRKSAELALGKTTSKEQVFADV